MKGVNIQSPFFEDADGNIWFTTERALNCYRVYRGDFDHYVLPSISNGDESILHTAFYFEHKRWLWVSAGDSLYRFDTKGHGGREMIQCLHQFNAMRCAVSLRSNGQVNQLFACFWDLSPGFEVITYDINGQGVRRDTFFNRSTHYAKALSITCREAIVENDSLAWLATDKGLLAFQYDNPNRLQIYAPPGRGANIRGFFKQGENCLWVISNEGAILPFDTNKRIFGKAISNNVGEKITDVDKLQIDDEKTMWYATDGEGVSYSKLVGRQFKQPLLNAPRKKTGITNFFENGSGEVLCLTQLDGIYLIDKALKFKKTLHFPPYSKLFKGKNARVWNVSALGLGAYNTVSNELKTFLPSNGLAFYDIAENSRGTLFLGCSGKMLEVPITSKTGSTPLANLPEGAVKVYFDKFDHLWVGTSENLSVWEFNPNQNPVRKRLYPNTGIINHIVEDKTSNGIWVGSASGLLRIDLVTFEEAAITEHDGLPNQYIYAIVPDRMGNLWLSSNQGVIKYMPYKPLGHQFKQYTTRNGLSSDEFCPGAALMSRSGHIWFGSTKGVDVFHPDSIFDIGTAPQLAIVGLKIHDHEWRDSSTCIEMANRIELAYNENTLRLELAAMEYTFPEMNKFRVRLLNNGNDTSWVDLGTQNFITYANLRPGNYRFEFTACNSEGIWQETPRQLDIIIHPHFTQTWWFPWLVGALALIVIGFGTAFYYRYQLRLQQLALERQQREAERKQLLLETELALQEERNRIADEMHDELGGGLSTIRLASQRAKKVQSPEELQGILKRVSQISIGLVNNMRGIIWAMDSQNDSLRSLLAYIRQYAGTFLDDNGIRATLTLPSDFSDRSLSSQYRHNVMLTVKECLNNILKHAEATAVELSVDLDNQLHIHIRDNGKGFDPVEHAGMGKGLRTTVKRMESVGGSIEWRRNPEGGMTVTLLAPLL